LSGATDTQNRQIPTIKKADDTVTTFNNTIEKIKRSNERRVEVLMKSNV